MQPNNKDLQKSFWYDQLSALVIALLVILLTVFLLSRAKAEVPNVVTITSIYWSDADSGRINGDIKFRLNSVDAPETGGVNAAIGGAKCELERERGFVSKEWIVGFTKGKELSVSETYGQDKYDRLVIDIKASGQDVARQGVKQGHLKPWPHKGSKALSKKPEWCDVG